MDSAVSGLFGAIVGALASIGTTWLANTYSFRMHSDKQKEERREKAREFQRTTLLDLQEDLYDAMRLSARAHLEDLLAYNSHSEWGKEKLSEEVGSGILLANRKVAILVERVENAEVRADVKRLMEMLTAGHLTTTKDEADSQQIQVAHEFQTLVQRLGTVLRSYY